MKEFRHVRNTERCVGSRPPAVKNGDERLVVLNGVARSVVEARWGIDPNHVFTYARRAIRRMLTSGWLRGRSRAGLRRFGSTI